MKLQELKIHNFMPYRGEHIISFPVALPKKNVMLVFGDNMRGKTSFLNAIRWAFFGKALGRHLKQVERKNIVNSMVAKEGEWHAAVSLRFEVGKDKYDLRREMSLRDLVTKPKSDADFEEDLSLSKNGKALSLEQALHEINQIIPEQISRFFLFDGELLQEYEMLLVKDSDQMKALPFTDIEAYKTIGLLWGEGILLDRQIKPVREEWLKPSHPEFQPRNAWSFYNACTSALKTSTPHKIMEHHIKLHETLTKGGDEKCLNGVLPASALPVVVS